jgi:hypothetical protein
MFALCLRDEGEAFFTGAEGFGDFSEQTFHYISLLF